MCAAVISRPDENTIHAGESTITKQKRYTWRQSCPVKSFKNTSSIRNRTGVVTEKSSGNSARSVGSVSGKEYLKILFISSHGK